MDLTHRFTVPATRDEAWTAFANLEGLAPCFPGATITSIDGADFAGTVKIKLGPIALLYTGTGKYVERDRDSARMVIEARGRDKRGNGTATATVAATFLESGDQTDVEVQTDLSITGKPAQFGRGVISDVSDKLLDQFVTCVSGRLTSGPDASEPELSAQDDTEPTVELGEVPGDVDEPDRAGPSAPSEPPAAQPDFNVVATVLPVLLKRYWPVLAGAAAVLFVVSKVIKGRRR